MSFDELFHVVKSIREKTSLPLTVDLEAGYSRDTKNIIKNIVLLSKAGVAGINLEDSLVESGNRQIVDANKFSETVRIIKSKLVEESIKVFLNIRTDTFILGIDNPLEETIIRAKLYEKSGADGIFIPYVVDESDIRRIVDSISIPLTQVSGFKTR